MIKTLKTMSINNKTGQDKPLDHSLPNYNKSINIFDYTTSLEADDIQCIRTVFIEQTMVLSTVLQGYNKPTMTGS